MIAIEEIKQRLDIVEVISRYAQLQKSGRSFKALCPFHSEKHASFYVFPERQTWHCFGSCGVGGDVFAFVMKKENLDFGQALRLLADQAGIALAPKDDARDRERERYYQVNSAAARFYHELLLESDSAESLRKYLEKRGLNRQAIDDFELGFSPDGWEGLRQHMVQRGYTEAELLSAGLLIQRESGGNYDRFRKRLMFPVRDDQGRTIGFGARALDDSQPKYLNSPQTAIFDKSGCLYGLDKAKAAFKEKNLAVIVEGYMDAIMAHQHGFHNVVASLGTSITEKQIGLLGRWTSNLALALDADAAGDAATLRGIQIAGRALTRRTAPAFIGDVRGGKATLKHKSYLSEQVKVIQMPRGKDPDEIIHENSDEWQRLVDTAMPVVEYAFATITARLDLSKANERAQALENLAPFVAQVGEPVEQGHYIDKLATLVRIDSRLVKKQVDAVADGAPSAPHQDLKKYTDYPLEERCLCLLLQCPDVKEQAAALSPEDFDHSPNREVFLAWQRCLDVTEMRAALDPSLHEYADSLLAKALPPAPVEQRRVELQQCLLRLRERWLKGLAVKDRLLLTEAQATGDAGGMTALTRRADQTLALGTQLKEVFETSLHPSESKELR